ncbi:hydrolase [Rhodobaculum claviforme]|uniref:Hydrolase n=2 Tax=Rhodobaculum claviforme TaxID=1549854 RepID=A0A934WIS5_9RHOB|nr:hydrolase [Rhodobaculum claviforme]
MMDDMARREVTQGPGATAAILAGPQARAMGIGPGAASVGPGPAGQPARPVRFTNLRLFDGHGGPLREGLSVLVEGARIAALVPVAETVTDAETVDCGGRVLMPGLIDSHWHATLCAVTQMTAMTAEVPYLHLLAAREAGRTLMRGFTTVRDCGGPSFALRRAIDEGVVAGPRIFLAGAMISQTSGHGDFRMRAEVPRAPGQMFGFEAAGMSILADGEAEVLRRAREQLLLGADHVKMMAGGGVTSTYDPIDSVQFTEPELRAGVQAAADWGTYVMTHVYVPAGIQRAIRAGVRSIEHGQLADAETARMMAGEGVWWSLQPFLADGDANVHADPAARAAQQRIGKGTEAAYEMAQRFGVPTVWGTDILFSPQNLPGQGHQLAKLARLMDPLTLLATATGRAGDLLEMSRTRRGLPGRLGVVEAGAMADLLVADGDPAVSLDFLADPEVSLRLIMRGGQIHKRTL